MADTDDEASQYRPPSWLDRGTLGLMTTAANCALNWGHGAEGAALAARDVVWARYPSLPLTMIADAVAAVVPDPAGLSATRGKVPRRSSGTRDSRDRAASRAQAGGAICNIRGRMVFAAEEGPDGRAIEQAGYAR